MPGSYQWWKAFNRYPGCSGEIRQVQDVANSEFQKYDLVHINISGVATNYILTIKELIKNSSTKLILNLDYAVEQVQEPWKERASDFLAAIRSADFLFAQEPFQRSFLQTLWKHVCGRKEVIPLVSHPVDTEGIKKFYVPPEDRIDMIAVQFHRYDGHLFIPSIIARGGELRTKGIFGTSMVEIPTKLYGYTDRLVDLSFFDYYGVRKNWDKYIYDLAHCTCGLSYYTIHSMDRFLAECACLGIPAVSTDHSFFGRLLFPRTCFPPLQLEKMVNAMNRLKNDEKFWNVVKDYAWDKVEQFADKPSVTKLLNAIRSWGIKI